LAEAALQGELARLMAAPEGQRNATLNRAAFSLGQIVAGGELDEALVVERLTATARAIGLGDGDMPTINSGLEAGMREPRRPQERKATGAGHNGAPEVADLSQDALAADMGARGWDQDARHVAMWGKWLFWTGARWEIDDRHEHWTRTRDYLRARAGELAEAASEGNDSMRRWATKQGETLRSKNSVAAVEALARSNPASVARPTDFDADAMLLGTPGGTVDLRTGELRTARREDRITKLTAVAPAPPGSTPARWVRFLQEIFEGDADLVAFMQRTAGYALTGSTVEHKLLFLHGTGRNGKSVFLNTLLNLWGDYARRAAAETFLHTQGDKHATGIAGLQGARLVIGSELPKGRTWDESVIKDLTGGDRMTARFMRGDFFDFDPQLTLMIAGNTQPSFRGIDEAIRARVVLVPFEVTIPPERRDKALPEKLLAEGPAILRWAIDGAQEWLEQGLNVPDQVAAASDEYFDDEDTLGQFLADATAQDSGAFLDGDQLNRAFANWCERQGLHPWTKRTLVKELRGRGFPAAKSNGRRGVGGLRLLAAWAA
jgi:putative DNA primase/helicase